MTYHRELEALADSMKLRHATAKNIVSATKVPDDIEVLFLLSVPAQLKSLLLERAELVIYTPSNEHFGIVPLEAMLAGTPVLAANTGGPLETVLDGETGWLRPINKTELWTEVMQQVLHELSDTQLRDMGDSGRRRVELEFSLEKMAHRLDDELDAMVKAPRARATELGDVALSIPIIGGCLFAIGAVIRAASTSQEFYLLEIFLGSTLLVVGLVGIVAVIYRLLQNESAYM